VGQYQALGESSTCFKCPRGKFSPQQGQTFCQECDGGTTEFEGSTGKSDCVICNEGYFGSPPDKSCTPCPVSKNIHCPEKTSYPYVDPGFWRIDAITILECSPTSACAFTGMGNNTKCSVAYTGQNCGNCNYGYYRLGLECKSCPNVLVRVLTFLGFFVLFIIILIRLLRFQGSISPDAKIAMQSMQIMALYSSISSKWPPYLKAILNSFSLTVRTV
jgi:hypothetical protein